MMGMGMNMNMMGRNMQTMKMNWFGMNGDMGMNPD
jgi:hypothetical protein